MTEVFVCLLFLGVVASMLWITVLTAYHFFDFCFMSDHNQLERFARALGNAIRQTLLVNNGQWIVFVTMTLLAFLIGIVAQFARPPVIDQIGLEARQSISQSPAAQKTLNFLWEGRAEIDSEELKEELAKERKKLYAGSGFAFLPWFTCAFGLLIWTCFYLFFAISDEIAEVARNMSERLGARQSAGGHAAEGMWPALRELWLARQSRQRPTTPATTNNPTVVQPSLLTIAGMALGTDFLFNFFERLWHSMIHRQV